MRTRTIAILLLATTLLVRLFPAQGQTQSPWLGTWKLNPEKSVGSASASRYKRVIIHIEPVGNGLRVTYNMVGTRGGITHMEWTGAFDGKDYPVQGVDNAVTNAYTPIDHSSYRIAVKLDGALAATAVVTVAPDGRTLTTVTRERDPHGKEISTTAVYDRQ
jgi:hypothetical protein